jgi:hypothetical protein
MDARRAFEVLGLSSPTSEEGLRRAYLKAVRAHGPERDPAGFAEVRAAYELLARMRSLPVLTAHELEPLAPESTRARAEHKAPPSSPGRLGSSPPTRQSVMPPPPQAASPADGFLRLLAEENPSGAAQLLLREWTENRGTTAPAAHVLTCTLQLFEAGAFGLAIELLRAFEAVTERAESRPSTFDCDVIARWMLLSELAAVSAHVDSNLVAALAAAVRSGRYRRARRVLDRSIAANSSSIGPLKRFAPALLAATKSAGSTQRASLRPARSAGVVPP